MRLGNRAAVDLAQVEKSGSARGDVAGDDVPRSKLVGEALATLVEEQRALAAQRLGQEQRGVDERRRMELHELEIRDCGASAIGRSDAVADSTRAGSSSASRAPQLHRSRAASHAHGWRRRSVTTPSSDHPDRQSSCIRSPSATSIRGWASTRSASTLATRSPVAAPPAWTTRLRLCPPSSPRSSSKLDAELHEVADPGRGLSGERRDGAWRRERPRPVRKRVLGMERRCVVVAERGGDPALSQRARGQAKRPLREHENPSSPKPRRAPRTSRRRLRRRRRGRIPDRDVCRLWRSC